MSASGDNQSVNGTLSSADCSSLNRITVRRCIRSVVAFHDDGHIVDRDRLDVESSRITSANAVLLRTTICAFWNVSAD